MPKTMPPFRFSIRPTAKKSGMFPMVIVKEGGLGREGGREGIAEYLETKLGGFSV
jgi:succinate-semialdehyde dehydrogenase/glutarate-semialdehyde dehydrogenase